jgi:hypothetical protein
VHGIAIEELLIAPEAYGASALPGRVVLGVRPGLRQACGTVQCPAETATQKKMIITTKRKHDDDLPVFHLGLLLDAVVAGGARGVAFILGDLVGELEDRVLLVEEDEVVVLDLHLRDLLGNSVVFTDQLLPLRVSELLQILKLVRPYILTRLRLCL